MRLIDADALKESIDEHVYLVHHGFNETEYGCTQYGIHQIVDDAPTIDAVPVRHGTWIWKGEDGDSRFMCSVCQWKEYVPTCNGVPNIWQYCPSCGARMNGERKADDER